MRRRKRQGRDHNMRARGLRTELRDVGDAILARFIAIDASGRAMRSA